MRIIYLFILKIACLATVHKAALILLLVALPSSCRAVSYAGSPQTIGGLQQSMAQLLQVFNGNESSPTPQTQQATMTTTQTMSHSDNNHFKLLERHGDFLLVGAR